MSKDMCESERNPTLSNQNKKYDFTPTEQNNTHNTRFRISSHDFFAFDLDWTLFCKFHKLRLSKVQTPGGQQIKHRLHFDDWLIIGELVVLDGKNV